MYLLDTNVLSELRKIGTPKINVHVEQWANSIPTNLLYISVISIMEIEMGILKIQRKDSAQADILRNWFETKIIPNFSGRIIDIDMKVAKHCASLHIPDPKAERDALIAATASVKKFTMVTRNTKDFEFTGVKLINPWLTH